jgi:hypothetical protein
VEHQRQVVAAPKEAAVRQCVTTRVYVVPPGPETLELFYFRMLLTVVSGPTSFASLKTHNGTSHET